MQTLLFWLGMYWLASATLMVLWLVVFKLKKDPDLPIWGYLVPVIVLAPVAVLLAVIALIANELALREVWPDEH